MERIGDIASRVLADVRLAMIAKKEGIRARVGVPGEVRDLREGLTETVAVEGTREGHRSASAIEPTTQPNTKETMAISTSGALEGSGSQGSTGGQSGGR